LPLRICLSADLYPRVYFPDLTTSPSLAEIDSVDLVALDFFVGAMVAVGGRWWIVDSDSIVACGRINELYSSKN